MAGAMDGSYEVWLTGLHNEETYNISLVADRQFIQNLVIGLGKPVPDVQV